ncbi:MAG: hypothetical protein MJZ23_00560 [Paludibacteraceae bacterium]|nr:hypothetical protein [Paludibacteraceae bacterium]
MMICVFQACTDEDKEETFDKKELEAIQGVSVTGIMHNHTYVDLGLPSGTKWATYNVGATRPTEYGDYFAWGETKPKEDYRPETYKWCKGRINSKTKYCTVEGYGTVDYKTLLEAKDDAATANWGSAWRMPTVHEIDELIEGCDWNWVKDINGSGVNGRLGTSKVNGATIFLPAAGFREGKFLHYAGDNGLYWSSLINERNPFYAYFLNFDDVNIDCNNGYLTRGFFYCGQSVRAVLNNRQ